MEMIMYKHVSAALVLAALGSGIYIMAHRVYDWVEPQTASAQILPTGIRPWTAVGASGTVDETSIPFFGFTGPSAGYKVTHSVDRLEFRYNVTNTFDNNADPTKPGWNTLELGGHAPGTSNIAATFYRVNRCTGAQRVLCQVGLSGTTTATCRPCTVPAVWLPIDFSNFLYYVRVEVDRNTPGELPWVHTLRVF
jgi:hypothetical protein